MSEKRPDWPHGDEGRFVCSACAVEVRPVRCGVFRCPACGTGNDVTVLIGSPRHWSTMPIADMLRVAPTLLARQGVG